MTSLSHKLWLQEEPKPVMLPRFLASGGAPWLAQLAKEMSSHSRKIPPALPCCRDDMRVGGMGGGRRGFAALAKLGKLNA